MVTKTEKKKFSMGKFRGIAIVLVAVLGVLAYVLGDNIAETVEEGTFHIKRPFGVNVETKVIETKGIYGQWFGKIFVYKEVATIGFGKEVGEGTADIDAISVMFNDGSVATNSGLVRIKLPTEGDARRLNLLKDYSGGYDHFISAGVVPVIRNAVRLAANLRSAQDAYTTLALYQQAVKDQLDNGVYVSEAAIDTVINATGDIEYKQITKIKYGTDGKPLREANSLQELGCTVSECVVDIPVFDAKVIEMINKRKEEAMLTELSKQTALRAKQEAITAEQQGLANVATAKYEKEVTKVEAVTLAEQQRDVAKLAEEAARYTKAEQILLGEGEGARKRLVMQADGALEKKLMTYEKVNKMYADAIAKQKWVPEFQMGVSGDSKSGNAAAALVDLFTAKTAKDLSLDMRITGK